MLKPPTDKITAETREKLLALAEFIETDQRHGFWMGEWHATNRLFRWFSDKPTCGTTGCIAGYCGFMVGQDMCFEEAARFLRLRYKQAKALFEPRGFIFKNNRAQAVRVLRHFAYTGDVDWSV